ncbi:hypothetical protein C6P45_002255 [Maudiozyma exigua]|uniref:SHSP domain-containing protein n=1 Tax=Maudiozyma exigua TaxID=34358 RepID=A0A9P6WEZ4_MAUEX|nr:hypothetical protein C6P45_002255 [Kazachstania exigua]
MSFFNPYYNFFDSINNEVEDFNSFLNGGFEPTQHQKRLKANSTSNQLATTNGKQNSNQVVSRPTTQLDNWFDNDFALTPFNFGKFGHMTVPVDIIDHDNDYQLKITVPGVKAKKDINVEYDHNKSQITISGEIPSTVTDEDKDNVRVKERSSGKFKRVVTLPDYPGIDTDHIKADYSSGVLTLDVPKLKPKKGEKGHVKKIEVTSNESWSD